MATLDISFKAAKKLFIDTRKMQDAAERSQLEPYAKWGAYVRSVARNSIKRPTKKSGASKPGDPPKSRTGFLKNFIFWVRDQSSRSVVVGPVKLAGKKGVDVPSVLEYGGRVRRNAARIKRKLAARRDSRGRFVSGGYEDVYLPAGIFNQEPRPYMAPALQTSLPRTENFFRGKFK